MNTHFKSNSWVALQHLKSATQRLFHSTSTAGNIILNKSISVLKSIFAFYKPNYRLSNGEESPDSKEQSTGEQPGFAAMQKQIVPQKITAVYGKGENVR